MKPKKIIKGAEVKQMNLTPSEKFYMDLIVEDINKIRSFDCESTFTFAHWTEMKNIISTDKVTAYEKAIVFFIHQYAKMNGYQDQCPLRETADFVASKFFTSLCYILPIIKGFSATCKYGISVADTFGLNVLYIK